MSRLTAHFKGGQQTMPKMPDFDRLSPRVFTVIGKNPGPFALTGTNTYLIGQGPQKILLDTGEGNPDYIPNLEKAMESCGCTAIDKIIITHWHFDHLGGVPSVQERFGPNIPVVSCICSIVASAMRRSLPIARFLSTNTCRPSRRR